MSHSKKYSIVILEEEDSNSIDIDRMDEILKDIYNQNSV
jgi:phosphopantetheinyl transferase